MRVCVCVCACVRVRVCVYVCAYVRACACVCECVFANPGSCQSVMRTLVGNRGSELRRMEQSSSCYMFMALDGRGEERLIIFSHDPGSSTLTHEGLF